MSERAFSDFRKPFFFLLSLKPTNFTLQVFHKVASISWQTSVEKCCSCKNCSRVLTIAGPFLFLLFFFFFFKCHVRVEQLWFTNKRARSGCDINSNSQRQGKSAKAYSQTNSPKRNCKAKKRVGRKSNLLAHAGSAASGCCIWGRVAWQGTCRYVLEANTE